VEPPPPPGLSEPLPVDYLLWASLATLLSLLPVFFVASYVVVRRCGRLVQPADRYTSAGTQTAAPGEEDVGDDSGSVGSEADLVLIVQDV
jgi:hypothetical protein